MHYHGEETCNYKVYPKDEYDNDWVQNQAYCVTGSYYQDYANLPENSDATCAGKDVRIYATNDAYTSYISIDYMRYYGPN
jgi:hypothetical protein